MNNNPPEDRLIGLTCSKCNSTMIPIRKYYKEYGQTAMCGCKCPKCDQPNEKN